MDRTCGCLLALLLSSGVACAQTSPPDSPAVAFTFDDLPAHGPLARGQVRREVVDSILRTLQAEHMPAAYGFMNGFRMEQFPYQIHILQAWHNAGQPLGNHTYSHEELDTESVATFSGDVLKNEALLKRLDPQGDWHWFRYPFTEEGDTLAKRSAARAFLTAQDYRIAEVSLDFQDSRWNDAFGRCDVARNASAVTKLHDLYLAAAEEAITQTRALSVQLFGRDIAYILLMHVGAFDARMLPELIELFRARGFRFVTLPEAASDAAYAVDPGVAVKGGAPFLNMVALARGLATPPPSSIPAEVDAMCVASKHPHHQR